MREGSAPTILTSIFSDSISIPCLTSCLNYSVAPLWALADGLSLNFLLYTSNTTEWLHFHFSLSCIGEGNGNPLHCSCLENPRDRGAWWAAISGVAQSRTRLKWLSSSSSSPVYGLPRQFRVKESAYNVDSGSVPRLRRSPDEGNGNPLQ